MRFLLACFLFLCLSCARVDVQTSKPIQLDINMRVDVYQHVVKEVDSIEDQIYGDDGNKVNRIFGFSNCAYAADYNENELEEVVNRRKARGGLIEQLMDTGAIGENREAFLEERSGLDSSMQRIVVEENQDRAKMYAILARKNGVSISDIKKVVFQDHYNRARSGWWFEVNDNGRYVWRKK